MKKLIALIGLCTYAVAYAQVPVPATTTWSRAFLRSTSGAQAAALLGGGGLGGASNSIVVATNGSDITGARGGAAFASLSAAKAAAQNGDVIVVFPGLYTNACNLGFNGTWFFYGPSCILSNAAADAFGNTNAMFQDSSTITNINVLGFPTLIYETGTNVTSWVDQPNDIPNSIGANSPNAFLLTTNPVTIANLEINSTTFYTWQSSLSAFAFNIVNCSNVSVTVNNMYEPRAGQTFTYTSQVIGPITYNPLASGFVWQLGETHLRFNHIYLCSQYGVWSEEPASGLHTNNFYIDYAGEMNQKFYQAGHSPTYRTWWMNMGWLNCSNSTALFAFDVLGGYAYLKAEKVSDLAVGCFDVGNGGVLWADVQKLSSTKQWANVASATSNSLYLRVQQYEDLGGMTNGILVAGGSNVFEGGVAAVIDGNGINVGGGTNTFKGLTMDTSRGTHTNDWPMVVTGGSNYVDYCAFTAPANAFSIFSAANVNVYMQPASYLSPGVNSKVFLMSSTNATLAIAATGITNTWGGPAIAYVTSSATTFTNFNAAGNGVLTNTSLTANDQSFVLAPGWSIKAASGLSGNMIPVQ